MLDVVLKELYDSSEFWAVLLGESSAQSGPFDGACLICAKAILLAEQDAKLVRIVSDYNNGQTEHYGARLGGDIYDFGGRHVSPEKWVETFSNSENLGNCTLSVVEGFDSRSDIPDDPRASKRIASMILERECFQPH